MVFSVRLLKSKENQESHCICYTIKKKGKLVLSNSQQKMRVRIQAGHGGGYCARQ